MEGKIFLSHSSKDKEIVNSFMENILIGGLNISTQNIFNTSGIGTGIEPGRDWRNEIVNELVQANLIILFLSENYKKSEICQNEIGAAWVSGNFVLPVIIPPIDFDKVGVFNVKQIENLSVEFALDRVKDYIVNRFSIDANTLKSDIWTAKKKEFLADLEFYMNANEDKLKVDIRHFNFINILRSIVM